MRPFRTTLICGLLGLLSVHTVVAQHSRAVSFQGYLTDDLGDPIDGFVDIDVTMWDAASGGSSLWDDSFTNHPVANGLVTLILEGGALDFFDAWEGDRWLEFEADGELITPRTKVTGAPFALGLALPYGQSIDTTDVAFAIENDGGGDAIYAEAGVSGTTAIIGVNSATSGGGVGVYGSSEAPDGIGVRGFAESANGYAGFFDGGSGVLARGQSNLGPDLILAGSSASDDDGRIFSDPEYDGSDLWLHSNDDVVFYLDNDSTGADASFQIRHYASVQADDVIFEVDESGDVIVQGSTVHSSDRNRKQNISPVDPRRVLEDVLSLPISTWQYKNQDISHMGPMAQDFYAAFDVGNDERHIAAVDADGVALAAIQGLYELVTAQQAEIERMRQAMIDAGLVVEP